MPTVFGKKKVHHDVSSPKPSHRFLHSFYLYPSLKFETQTHTEQIVLFFRAHPITQISWIVTAFFMAIVPLIFNILLSPYLAIRQIIFIDLFWYAFMGTYIFLNILTWLFNVGIVTNERIIDVDFHNVLYKEVTASHLANIEDVTVRTGGFLASVFKYGNLFVQTAGAEANIEFINIPDPTEAARIINHLIGKKRNEH